MPSSASSAALLLERLRVLGLRWVEDLRLTRNRRTMVSIPPDNRALRAERTHPDDVPVAEHLTGCHARINTARFGGSLGAVSVRVSRRMKNRLGHFSPRRVEGKSEIAVSLRHLRRHGMVDAEMTLLHEMVHQWQHESGLPLGHGRAFRQKAREVGISPRATRKVD